MYFNVKTVSIGWKEGRMEEKGGKEGGWEGVNKKVREERRKTNLFFQSTKKDTLKTKQKKF